MAEQRTGQTKLVETEYDGSDFLRWAGAEDLAEVIVSHPEKGNFAAREYYPEKCGPMAFLMIYRAMRTGEASPELSKQTRDFIEQHRA